MKTTEELQIELKAKDDESYLSFNRMRISEAFGCLSSIPRFNPNYKSTPFIETIQHRDIMDYYQLISGLRYLNLYKEGRAEKLIYSMDIEKIEKILKKIENDKRVFHFNKTTAIGAIDLFYDLRIQINIFNRLCSSVMERGKEGNWAHASLKSAMEYTDEGFDTILLKDQLDRISKKSFFGQLKKYMDLTLDRLSTSTGADHNELKDSFSLFVSGDLRKLEKYLFPLLYKCILLNSDIGKYPEEQLANLLLPSAVKRDLLFDIFPVILPDREFKNNPSIITGYQGSFYKYRISTVKSLIGM